MATLLLQAAGAYIGGLFGAVGATIGTAAGALGGYLIDQTLINSTRHIKGARLSQMTPLTGEEGAPLARVYGTMRTGGTLIWATRFEEVSKSERTGAKGGPKVTTFSYHANFAVAICEGEVAHVRRIWADGRELDQTRYDIRIHKGGAGQQPDPLIEAKQGSGNTPSYRGTAYAVFDHFPLQDFGNRIPQVQFEVIRLPGAMAGEVRAVTLIPGSTEFGLAPHPVIHTARAGETLIRNRHNLQAETDWHASLDELQALCPALESVALVTTWFGDDLQAGHCAIRPGVTAQTGLMGDSWQVSGMARGGAHLVSEHAGRKAFGGTPDDATVIAAIRDLRQRGLKVTLYPFVMMDIPAGNTLPSPYGSAAQPSYPWRGDINCTPAPGAAGSADGTAAAAAQVSQFLGAASPGQFGASGEQVTFAGGADWGYRRSVLHHAKLAAIAGGVDAFLIGSELKGLTRIRSAGHTYPFVAGLQSLAADVRTMLGPDALITYAADWSEYGAYAPPGTDHLDFNLDPLWAHPEIGAIGIDNYMPLSDWRDSDNGGSNPDGASSSADQAAMVAAITSGEGHDWFYASAADRQNRVRTPIVDGLAGKHWVYRCKDIRGWWQNQHFGRTGTGENIMPTPWVPQSKPVWFTELGCAAMDKAANQPNIFPDQKSGQAAKPWFSNGGRDDCVQARWISAHFEHWLSPGANPVSGVYGGSMVDMGKCHLWAWDARPFPAFPLETSSWGDGGNWLTGHWLNGRLSGMPLDRLISAILADHDGPAHDCSNVDGFVPGYLLDAPSTAREALGSLLHLFRIEVSERDGVLVFSSRGRSVLENAAEPQLAFDQNMRLVTETVARPEDVADELTLGGREELNDFQAFSVRSVLVASPERSEQLELPASLDPAAAAAELGELHKRLQAGRTSVAFRCGWETAGLNPGDIVRLSGRPLRIRKISDGEWREMEAEPAIAECKAPVRSALRGVRQTAANASGAPWAVFLDLPALSDADAAAPGLRVAAWSKPWIPCAAFASPEASGHELRAELPWAATAGTLEAPLAPGFAGRWDWKNGLVIRLFSGSLSGTSDLQVLSSRNAAAVRAANGQWEILQFGNATETAPGVWRLGNLLRGQLGTSDSAASGAPAGAVFVLLDKAVVTAGLRSAEAEAILYWKIGPMGRDFSDRYFTTIQAGPANRAGKSFPPVHVSVQPQPGGAFAFSWIRQTRQGGDNWGAEDVALPEGSERYRLSVFDTANGLRRQSEVASPVWAYPLADRAADFGAGAHQAILEVRQLGADGLPGISARLPFSFTN